MMKEIEVIGVDIGQEGEGIAKTDSGYTVFVPYLLPGESAYIALLEQGAHFGKGEILELKTESKLRQKALCPVYYECGGCQLQHLSYQGQLQWKEKKVKDSLTRLAGINAPQVSPIIGMETPWYYRNRGQFVIGEENGTLRWGFFTSKTHKVVSFKECPIHHRYLNEAMQDLIPQLSGLHSFFEGDGTLRHVSVRCGVNTEEVLATLVTTEPLGQSNTLDCSKIKRAVGLVENINKTKSSKILGEKEKTLCGRPYLEEKLMGLRYLISSQSFFQNNTEQTEKLYQKVLQYAKPKGKRILDLYSGIGSISLALAKEALDVVGIEIVKAAVRDAKANAKLNGIENVRFHTLDVADAFKQEKTPPDVLVMDPPRKGIEKRVLADVLKLTPQTIVYVSCNPDTLARDLRILKEKYELIEATPIDVFPQTTHVETVVLLSRVDK